VELYLHSPEYVFMAWCLVKHRDNFTFHLYYLAVVAVVTAVAAILTYFYTFRPCSVTMTFHNTEF